jgi:chloramphenicol 3-O phosphotransferase
MMVVPLSPRAICEEGEHMEQSGSLGRVVVLNGAPRAGKSSIAAAIQETLPGVWINLGVDSSMRMTPRRYRPGIGLRPGGERPDLEPLVVALYRALYLCVAAHSRLGLNAVVDIGHHDAYSVPRGILPACARLLDGLPALFVGVHCPLAVVMERRIATGMLGYAEDGSVPAPVRRWQESVHRPGIYDLEVDTSVSSPDECAEAIRRRLREGPPGSAFKQLASMAT